MKKKELFNTLLLIGVAIIWGLAFVAQSVGSNYVGPFTFLALRSVLAALVLLPIILITKPKIDGYHLKAGMLIGIWLTAASYFQQAGIEYTTTAKAGFITALYVIYVPIVAYLVFKKKIDRKIWFCMVLSVIGLYLLCNMSFDLDFGDTMVFICGFLFTGHVLTIDYYADKTNCVVVSFIQFVVVSIIAGIGMLIFEPVQIESLKSASSTIIYAGVMSSGIGYTLQMVGQRNCPPAVAVLALSLESAFAAIFGFIIQKQGFSPVELVGCILMFASIIISQIPSRQ